MYGTNTYSMTKSVGPLTNSSILYIFRYISPHHPVPPGVHWPFLPLSPLSIFLSPPQLSHLLYSKHFQINRGRSLSFRVLIPGGSISPVSLCKTMLRCRQASNTILLKRCCFYIPRHTCHH